MRYSRTLFLLIIIFINSCSYPKIDRDDLIYDNDFENENFSEIDGKATSTFNNTTVLGDFNRYGLRAHQEIKLNNKRNDRIYFNMNY